MPSKSLLTLAAALASLTVTVSAAAEPQEKPVFQAKVLAEAGGPLVLAFSTPRPFAGKFTTKPFTGLFGLQIGSPRYSPAAIEFGYVPGSGYGANLLINMVSVGGFRLHLLDPGVFVNAVSPVSVARMPRKIDVAFGAGAALAVSSRFELTLDWRVYLPDPVTGITKYANIYGTVYADEAVKGAQWRLGFTCRL